jgi:hypothetical protein
VAKRGRPRRATSLDGLVGQLNQLDQQRKAVFDQIRRTTEKLLSGESLFPWSVGGGGKRRGRPVGSGKGKRKMSAAARKRISEAQKKRWAEKRKAEK